MVNINAYGMKESNKYHLSRVMEDNFVYNLSMADYAQLCHMSLSTFNKAFRKYYHSTPAAWIKKRKLQLAYERVVTTDATINQIALECGFEDTLHFIRMFKEKYKRTPFHCRKEFSEIAAV
jgi:AraC-like DNA-binding protein